MDIQDLSNSVEGSTNYVLINRFDVLKTAIEEIKSLDDVRLTLQVSFYGERAEDYGGPRKECFRLC